MGYLRLFGRNFLRTACFCVIALIAGFVGVIPGYIIMNIFKYEALLLYAIPMILLAAGASWLVAAKLRSRVAWSVDCYETIKEPVHVVGAYLSLIFNVAAIIVAAVIFFSDEVLMDRGLYLAVIAAQVVCLVYQIREYVGQTCFHCKKTFCFSTYDRSEDRRNFTYTTKERSNDKIGSIKSDGVTIADVYKKSVYEVEHEAAQVKKTAYRRCVICGREKTRNTSYVD